MADFALAQLSPPFLEQVITKLEWKSYFRIQQTCKLMEETVRTTKVTVTAKDEVELRVKNDGDNGSPRFILIIRFPHARYTSAGLESLYGVRVNCIEFLDWSATDGEELLTKSRVILQKYRITSQVVDVNNLQRFTDDEYVSILKLLKPVKVMRDNLQLNQVEALQQVQHLTELELRIDPEDNDAINLLLSHKFFSKLRRLNLYSSGETSAIFPLMKKILRFLHSNPMPNLCQFVFSSGYDPGKNVPSGSELLEMFSDFNPTLLMESEPPLDPFTQPNNILECRVGPDMSLYKIETNHIDMEIVRMSFDKNCSL